jgi:photosystem II stability/assembly factor-like uncharacterized protein
MRVIEHLLREGARAGYATVAVCVGCIVPLSTMAVTPPPSPEGGTGGTSGSAGTSNPGLGDAAPPSGTWANVTSNLAGLQSECGTLTLVVAKPDEDLLIAGVATQGLWSSRDGGGTWQQLGTGAGSTPITNRPSSLVFDPLMPTRFWESGIYGSTGGVFETSDDGMTFQQLGDAQHNDVVSVDLTDPARKTLLAGGHEQSQTLFRSSDGGMTWNNIGGGLPAATNCTHPLVIDSQTYLVGCGGYGGGPSGVYRSTDSGATWMMVSTFGGATAPLSASDGSIYWATPGTSGMARSTDAGEHWTNVFSAYGVLSIYPPVELPDGRIAALGTQYIMLSADHGSTWKPVTPPLPFQDGTGIAYSAPHKAFYVWHFACGNGPVVVQAESIMRFDFDYQKM